MSEHNMLLGEMKQSIKTTEENCQKIFDYLHEMRTNGLPMCAAHTERIGKVETRLNHVEIGLVRTLLAMVGSGALGGMAGDVLARFLGV